MENTTCCCCERTTDRSAEDTKKLLNRLSRIEGQVRGLKGMVEKSAYCPDILMQASAVNAAINAFNRELLAMHLNTCVAEGVKNGDTAKIDEIVAMLPKLMK